MKKLLAFFALLFSSSSLYLSANAMAPSINVPMEFTIRERIFSWTSTFDVETATQKIGTITKKFFSLTPQFKFYSSSDELIASAKARFFSWGTTADVYDSEECFLGWIEEEFFSFFSPSKYRVFSKDNRLVANAKMNFWGTKFYIRNPNNNDKDVALISHSWFRCFSDKWTVKILDPSAISAEEIDPRLLIMVAVYRTDSENAKKRQHQMEQASKRQNQQNTQLMLECDLTSSAPKTESEQDFIFQIETLKQKLKSYTFIVNENEPLNPEDLENEPLIANLEKQDREISYKHFREEDPISQTALIQLRVEREALCVINTLEKGIEILEDPNLQMKHKQAAQSHLIRLAEHYTNEQK